MIIKTTKTYKIATRDSKDLKDIINKLMNEAGYMYIREEYNMAEVSNMAAPLHACDITLIGSNPFDQSIENWMNPVIAELCISNEVHVFHGDALFVFKPK